MKHVPFSLLSRIASPKFLFRIFISFCLGLGKLTLSFHIFLKLSPGRITSLQSRCNQNASTAHAFLFRQYPQCPCRLDDNFNCQHPPSSPSTPPLPPSFPLQHRLHESNSVHYQPIRRHGDAHGHPRRQPHIELWGSRGLRRSSYLGGNLGPTYIDPDTGWIYGKY